MKVITGNRVTDGVPVYRSAAGEWTETIRDAALYGDAEATDVLADATAEETKVVGPYIMTVDAPGEPTRREAMRENIRKLGPSVHPEMARAQNAGRGASKTMVVYGNSASGNCLKVKWTADLLGLAYEWIETDNFAGATQTEDFLKLNPAGQVPVVVLADGRALAQSNAIILHLAELAASSLVPRDPYQRAKLYEWLFWEQYTHEPAIAVRRAQIHFLKRSADDLDPQLLHRGERALGRMELALLGGDYLVGDALTLADISLVAYTRWAHQGGFDLGKFPTVLSWVHRVERDLGLESAREAA